MKRAMTAGLLALLLAAFLAGCFTLDPEAPGAAGQVAVAPQRQPPPAVPSEALRAGSDWAAAAKARTASWRADLEPEVVRLTPLVKKDPRANLEALVIALVRGRSDDFEKVKALHDWVARNIAYDDEGLRDRSKAVTEPYGVIAKGMSVCAGYSKVFQLLCSMARVECAVVSGYGRGISFQPLEEGRRPYAGNHAWNAVRIQGGWYLVDTTWDAGGGEVFHWDYSTGYLFTPPEIFLCTHFPEDPRWQLLDTPTDYARFNELPYIEGAFGTMRFASESALRRVSPAGSESELLFRCPPGAALNAWLRPYGQKKSVPRAVASRRDGDLLRVRVLFPGPGTWELGMGTPGSDGESEHLGTLYFTATAASDKRAPYLSEAGRGLGITSSADLGYTYQAAGEASVTFRCPGQVEGWMRRSDDKGVRNRVWIEGSQDQRIARFTFPEPGEYTVSLGARSGADANRWESLLVLTYVATAGSDVEFPAFGPGAERIRLSFAGGEAGYHSHVPGECRVAFSAEGPVSASLMDKSGAVVAPGRVLLRQEGPGRVARVSFPAPGEYDLWLSAPKPDKPGSYEWAGMLHFECSAGSEVTFPVMYRAAEELGFQLVSPLTGRLAAGTPVELQVAGPAGGRVSASVKGRMVPLARVGDLYRGTVSPNGDKLTVFCSTGASEGMTALAGFSVTPSSHVAQ